MYRKIGEITRFSEIPWGKEIIVTGSIGNGSWVQRMKGVFEQNSNDYRFKNEFGMSTRVSPGDSISLNVLEEVSGARRPKDAKEGSKKAGIEQLDGERRGKASRLADIASQSGRLENEIADLSDRKAVKLLEWHEAHDRAWTGLDTCPTCGQKLPADQIEAAKSAFNRQRAEALERLKADGTTLRDQVTEKQGEIESLRTEGAQLEKEVVRLDSRLEKGRGMVKPCIYETQIEYKQLNSRLIDLKSQLARDANAEKAGRLGTLESELSSLKQQIQDAERIKLQIKQAEEQGVHVKELEAKQGDLSAELGRWEKAVALCEDYVKQSARALETTVNGKFKIAHFRMFQMQKNGEEAECCDVVYPNGSTTLSTGERLQTGIDIINTLSEYYGVDAPIWIDNMEGITLPIESKAQIISLIVSPKDEKLRTEVES